MRTQRITYTFRCNGCGKEKQSLSIVVPKGWQAGPGISHFCPTCLRLEGKRPRNLSPEEIRRSLMTFAKVMK